MPEAAGSETDGTDDQKIETVDRTTATQGGRADAGPYPPCEEIWTEPVQRI